MSEMVGGGLTVGAEVGGHNVFVHDMQDSVLPNETVPGAQISHVDPL